MNDKRRMLNRFLHGSGVVSGMNVVRVDDTTISVEMGLALDFSGREIVIETPIMKKLSMIEGFESSSSTSTEDTGYVYLCIEYAEVEKDAVHSITSANVRSMEQMEYNKVSESYRMFLTTIEPEQDGFTTEHFYRDTQTIFWNNGIRIKQIIPKYVKKDSDFELQLIVENMGQQQPFAFHYDLDLTCMTYQGQTRIAIDFDEKEFAKAGKYFLSYPLKAMSVADTEGVIVVNNNNLTLKIGEKEVAKPTISSNRCKVVGCNPKEELKKEYYKTAMEEIVKNTYQQSIYLAKIGVIKAANTYVIEEIEQMPFGQYVYNSCLALAIQEMDTFELEQLKGETSYGEGGSGVSHSLVELGKDVPAIATGTVTLDLGIGGKEGQCFYSSSITHGLGLGPVQIVLGQACTTSDDSDRIFGDFDIFETSDDTTTAHVKLGAKTNVKDGTFVIGAKVLATTNARKVRVDWMALKDRKDNIQDLGTKKIMIKPEMKDILVRESCYFEAVFMNISDKRVKWSVKEIGGGTIDANGRYTAPNIPGVYEVLATSLANPELVGSVYVVVRERLATGK